MSVFLVVDITIHDPEQYQEYVSRVPPFIEKHQGTYRIRGGKVEIREGNWRPQRLVVIEFPTKDQAEAFLKDPDYQPVAAMRHAAATTNMVLVEGF